MPPLPPTPTPTLDLPALDAAIPATRFHHRLQHFASVGSTNQLALEAALAGARHGVWVADQQTAGRGRGGHAWYSAPGDGLYVSALVTPRIPLSHAARIPLATGLAARAAVLEATGLAPDIRWPNDLMFGVHHDARKFGGILVESASTGGSSPSGPTLSYAVIGIGLNLNHPRFPPALASLATSLHLETGRLYPREPILAALLRHLDRELTLLDAAPADPTLLDRFTAASTWASGKRVHVGADGIGEQGGFSGITRGLDPHGFLLVQDDSGTLRTVLSGGVRSA